MKLLPGKIYRVHFDYDSCDTTKYRDLAANELIFTSEELLHAVITCGMPQYYLTDSVNVRRKDELLYKISILQCALDEQPDPSDPRRNILVFSENLRYLDPSEKAALSYYIGMFFTKLISSKIFHVQYLVHLSIAQMNHTITFQGNNRPDLIGYNLRYGNYSVFEAKGRIRFVRSTLNNAYKQTQTIQYISGQKPSLRAANMTYFKRNVLHSYICDPEGNGDLSIDFSPEKVLRQYYQPVYELISANHDTSQNTIEPLWNQNRYFAHIFLPEQHSVTVSLPSVIYRIFSDRFSRLEMSEIMTYAEQQKDNDDFVRISFD